MKLSDLKTYWTNAATNNLAIAHVEGSAKHFCSYTVEDALSNLRDMLSPALCLEMPSMAISDGLSDNIRLVSDGAVLIIKKCSPGNSEEIETAFIEMETVGLELISKMLNDRKKANDTGRQAPEKHMKHLDLNKIKMVDVGPVFESFYGWRVEFNFNGPVDLDLDESKWAANTETAFTN